MKNLEKRKLLFHHWNWYNEWMYTEEERLSKKHINLIINTYLKSISKVRKKRWKFLRWLREFF